MLDQQDIDLLRKYEPNYKLWKDAQIFTGFGSEGIKAIAIAHIKTIGTSPNMSCEICAINAMKRVYEYYEAHHGAGK